MIHNFPIFETSANALRGTTGKNSGGSSSSSRRRRNRSRSGGGSSSSSSSSSGSGSSSSRSSSSGGNNVGGSSSGGGGSSDSSSSSCSSSSSRSSSSSTWGTPGTPFLVQIHKSCLFIVFDGFHVQDRKFTPFPIAERFFTSFWLNCVQITFTLRSNCVQITFNYVQVAQKLRTMSSFESALWKAVPDNNSCPTFQ